mmetsp:Transcript_25332/g.45026  ORF Transcript_25332/g.45026 Transcript_25332/m.45026 type:complete len:209 (+) Transcript_25332:207-833(+)|eukprot:CAMPEP_0197525170 /NCGR_PEP_ID=MMETSP1318-20131121/10663_1 /TAXON_ID=552666 /ORGANISM="Partenskyella glossopodia, Strain RCC365" /LENGTH=208 /DNA_ID=CAMNT_0043078353 /DNA_START=179 /DNA_END=805 /DNA_ORIENTATION=-
MSSANYSKATYWDARYTKDKEPFEWYQSYRGIKHILKPLIKPDAKILVVGCGNSRLSADLFDDASVDVTSIDISQVVIDDMQLKYRKKKGMQFIKMDAKNMDFKDNTYDLIVDKGLSDCLLCGDDGEDDISTSLSEISRVLAPGGVYICVSFGDPDSREDYFSSKGFHWEVSRPVSVPKPAISSQQKQSNHDANDQVHWCYIAKKNDA